jgi:bifunctional N-acetylglucosamine-1-phosphate-uridyltransferase/glucosamine-1-phosphate-acetyltransferase GlmU-like protein
MFRQPYSNYGNGSTFQSNSRFGAYNQFGDNCHFGPNCNFQPYSKFGKKCSFGPGCKFQPYCKFEKSCKFGNFCSFSPQCKFGISFQPNALEPIIYENLLMNLTDYTMPIINTIIDFVGSDSNCEFGNNIQFGPYCSIGPKSIVGNFAKLGPYCEVKENCIFGSNLQAPFRCILHPSTKHNMNG